MADMYAVKHAEHDDEPRIFTFESGELRIELHDCPLLSTDYFIYRLLTGFAVDDFGRDDFLRFAVVAANAEEFAIDVDAQRVGLWHTAAFARAEAVDKCLFAPRVEVIALEMTQKMRRLEDGLLPFRSSRVRASSKAKSPTRLRTRKLMTAGRPSSAPISRQRLRM